MAGENRRPLANHNSSPLTKRHADIKDGISSALNYGRPKMVEWQTPRLTATAALAAVLAAAYRRGTAVTDIVAAGAREKPDNKRTLAARVAQRERWQCKYGAAACPLCWRERQPLAGTRGEGVALYHLAPAFYGPAAARKCFLRQ